MAYHVRLLRVIVRLGDERHSALRDMNTPTAGVIHGLLYGASRVDETLEHDIDAFDAGRFESEAAEAGLKRPSIYIEAFEGTHYIGG